MTKLNFNKCITIVGKIAPVLLAGLKYMITGTLTLGLFATSIAGFYLVSKDSGYVAVLDFIASCLVLAVAVACMYFIGLPKKQRGGRYAE